MPEKIPGKSLEINGGEGDGSFFYFCEDALIADSFDGITTQPIEMPDGTKRVLAYVTFLGRSASGDGEPKGITLVMSLAMTVGLRKAMRDLFVGVPLPYRVVDLDKDLDQLGGL